MYFWLRWVFLAEHRLSLVAAHRLLIAVASRCRARALGTWASVVVARRLSSCGSWALERRLSSCGTRALLLHGMWDLPRPRLEPVSPALAGGFLTTAPPGKSSACLFKSTNLQPDFLGSPKVTLSSLPYVSIPVFSCITCV